MAEFKYVLYTDDDVDDVELMCEGFKNFPDYKLLTFKNGLELLSFLKHKNDALYICLIILDINMPVVNGIDTLIQLKNDHHYQPIPTVLFSTAGSPSDRRLADSVKTDIVLKPSSFKDIYLTIERLLDHCSEFHY